MPGSLEWLRQWMKRRAASGLSLMVHGMVVVVIASCPPRAAPRLRLLLQDSLARRPARPRLVFLLPRPKQSGAVVSPPRRAPQSRANAPNLGSAASSLIAVDSAGHVATDTTPAMTGPPAAAPVDSGPAKEVEYERPIHPALRGLVPTWNGGAIWRGMVSATSLVPALRPRPPDCVQGAPGYFGCVDRLQRWRDDSIYHVRVRCHASGRVGQLFPPDCGRFRSDSTPD